jgi:hypothetical protein
MTPVVVAAKLHSRGGIRNGGGAEMEPAGLAADRFLRETKP